MQVKYKITPDIDIEIIESVGQWYLLIVKPKKENNQYKNQFIQFGRKCAMIYKDYTPQN